MYTKKDVYTCKLSPCKIGVSGLLLAVIIDRAPIYIYIAVL